MLVTTIFFGKIVVKIFVVCESLRPFKRPLHTIKIFTKIFLKKSLGKLLSLYKTVEKLVAVVKKSCSVYGR